MESTRTITELKSSFIRAQIRILSERIEPPEDWRSYATGSAEEELRDKVVDDVLQKFNTALKQHNRVVYPSQAVQHVAQQITSLYWSSVSQDARSRNSLRWGVEKSVDLSGHMNITQLPTELEDQLASEEDRIRYRQLRERLVKLDDQRQRRRRRLDQLRRLQELLEPFGNPQENIQPNLITRDGELVQELEKMRMLAARVGGRIEQNKAMSFNPGSQDGPLVDSDQKLAALMDMTWDGDE